MGRRARRQRRRRNRLAFAILLGLVLVTGTWLWLRGGHLPDPPLAPPRLVARSAARAPRESAARTGPAAHDDDRDPASSARRDRDGAAATPPTVDRDRTPRLAIVIDDLGASLESARAVLHLEPPVTIAVIPFTAAAPAVAAAAVRAGREVILHLPLEPEGRAKMEGGAGFLETAMTRGAIDAQLERDLRAVPYIVGVNGHMGSRFTSDPAAMETLLGALHQRGLFFLDSVTTTHSVAAPIAARLGVPFGARNVFLDHDPTTAETEERLGEAIAIAKRDGSAIAIGHPHATTIAVLARRLEDATRQGVRVVPLSFLVR